MIMKDKKLISIFVLMIALGLSLFWNYKQYRDYKEQPTIVKEKVVVQYVEKKDTMPTAKEETSVGTVKIPVKKQKSAAMENQTDSVLLADDVQDVQDSVEIELTQKVYSDSTYTAYVSGYKPNLDSIFIRQRYVTNTRIEERVVKEKAFRRLNFGITVGYGYGFQSKTFEPFAGVGITYYPFK